MAAAVPLIAGAFLGPVGAAIVTVAFSVTGISKKINDAAVSVFGEDLAKIGNLAAIAYAGYSAFSDPTAAASTGIEGITSESAAGLADGFDVASEFVAPSAAPVVAQAAPEAVQQVAAAAPIENAVVRNAITAQPAPVAVAPIAREPATVMDAIRAKPALEVPAVAPTSFAVAPPVKATTAPLTSAAAPSAAGNLVNTGKNFFDKLAGIAEKNPIMAGNVIAGLGNAASASSTRAQQQAQYEDQIRRLDRLRGIGSFRLKG